MHHNPEVAVLLFRVSICKTFCFVNFCSHILQHESNAELLTYSCSLWKIANDSAAAGLAS